MTNSIHPENFMIWICNLGFSGIEDTGANYFLWKNIIDLDVATQANYSSYPICFLNSITAKDNQWNFWRIYEQEKFEVANIKPPGDSL